MTPEELCELLRMPFDPKWLAHQRWRQGLPYVSFRGPDGKCIHRYPKEAVLAWVSRRASHERKRPRAANRRFYRKKREFVLTPCGKDLNLVQRRRDEIEDHT